MRTNPTVLQQSICAALSAAPACFPLFLCASIGVLALACGRSSDDGPAGADSRQLPSLDSARMDASTISADSMSDASPAASTGDAGRVGSSGPDEPEVDAGPEPPPPVTCTGPSYDDAWLADSRMCLSVFAAELSSPRQFAFAPNGDLFVSDGSVRVLWDDDGDGVSGADERATFGSAEGLSHGLAFDREQRFVYVSSAGAVYRFAYASGQRDAGQDPELVIRGIPGGGHSTRSLVFDSRGRLYVSVGSSSNLDTSEALLQTRAQIRRFELGDLPAGGLAYDGGEVVASGMRNEVGLFIDARDRLWGVENERDSLEHDALGGDIHDDNPAEEINLVDGEGPAFYGYPFCYSEYRLAGGMGPGTQWADPNVPESARKTDAWCRDAANVRAPAFTLQAHYAPLGIVQYSGRALPMRGDFVITAHGSWNRSPAVGRLLLRAHHDGERIVSAEPIVGGKSGSRLGEGSWDARPVDVQQGPDHALYFSDDEGGRIFKLGYRAD